jgi:hypothetical protein
MCKMKQYKSKFGESTLLKTAGGGGGGEEERGNGGGGEKAGGGYFDLFEQRFQSRPTSPRYEWGWEGGGGGAGGWLDV